MKSLRLQPTFTVDVPSDAEQTIAALRTAIADDELSEHAMAAGTCFEFFIAPTQQRFWSPHLSIQISPRDPGSQLFGRFSPRPEIWTMVMAIYGVVLIFMFAAAIYGYVQWMLGTAPWALTVLPIGVIVIGSLHAASLVGQNLSSDQMHLLRSRLDRAIELAFPERPLAEDAVRE
ncbi:hypothetical protein [Roseimaritima ulvae]|uniref:Uncharacterized protein n=1 Tax=Roseimaritima ulvae TaxID=980254 RepID=A0A5B9QX68_9BACT|nr:hypothetical protein [Roseimaritima ulvae]QEG43627.1 hypothetical protein UC8_56780 [Roseimaritima ulvae]